MRVMRVHPAFILPAFILPTFLLAACGGSSGGEKVEQPQPATEQPQPAAEQPQPAAGETADQQTARGGELYGKNCAGCHGDAGQGGAKAPPLVGGQALPLEPRPGAKRDGPRRTCRPRRRAVSPTATMLPSSPLRSRPTESPSTSRSMESEPPRSSFTRGAAPPRPCASRIDALSWSVAGLGAGTP